MNELGRLEDLPQDYREDLTQTQPGAPVAQPARRAAAGKPTPRTQPPSGPTRRCARC
jgi:hypothetical protein